MQAHPAAEPGADFGDAVLGLALPADAEAALQEASRQRAEPVLEAAALMRAQTAAPEHPAVLIALYRSHFYARRLRPARDIAHRALAVGAQALGLPPVWREVPPHALSGAQHDPATRFYLFTLKALAYLSLRLGDDDTAREALALLRALDPQDRVGGALVEAVRQRALAVDGADDPATDIATGAAAWARLSPAPLEHPHGRHPA